MSDSHERQGPLVRYEHVHIAENSMWRKLPLIAAVVGIACLGGAVMLGQTDAANMQKFWFCYLTAVMFGLAFGLGGLFFVLIQHAARAGWSIVLRRLAENMALTLPLMGLLILPIVFGGAHDLFHWTDTAHVAHDPVLQAKAAYLNEGSFRGRAVAFIAIWSILGLTYWRWSTSQDLAQDPRPVQLKMRTLSTIGILLFGTTLTFGAFDWLMSLDPHWFSTIFGIYYFAGCVVSTHAFLALIVILLHRAGYLRGIITKEHFHDLGKMMFAFTVFWAYIGFSQYFLIWYASIPEETGWYAYRGHGDFLYLSLLLVVMRFVLPFPGLISRHIKRNPKTLVAWAIWILLGQFVDMYWLVQPAHAHLNHSENIQLGALDLLTLVGVAGLWLAVFIWGLTKNAMVPLKDPRLEESITFENF